MIEISNLRIEEMEESGQKRLVADINSDIKRMDEQTTIWISLDEKYGYMLTDEVYDAFLFLPVYMSMYYHTDLYIRGNVSKMLYRNVVDYLQPLMCDFSCELVKTNIYVDGFQELNGNHSVIGTGISCGVDCLATIYDYFEKEKDEEYRITHLFMLNVGWHGEYGDPRTMELFHKRCRRNKKAADEMGLPFVAIDSNLHAFLYPLDDKASFFAIYSTIFALEKEVGKYYISSNYSYDEVSQYGRKGRNKDFAGYADPMAIPLMQSKSLRLISDGLQYTRVEKTRNIADWEIAQKYLNVCCRHSDDEGVDESNCSNCVKCRRTLITLDGLGKLDKFAEVFDIGRYKAIKNEIVEWVVKDHENNAYASEIYDLFKQNGNTLSLEK